MNYDKMSDEQKQQTIKNLYEKERKSFAQIADTLQTYANKIRRDAKKFKINIRDKSLAQKNALNTGTHKHPTKGQTRSDKTKEKIGLGVLKNWENLSDAEIEVRKEAARKRWDSLSNDERTNMIELANKAVRDSSKTGSKLEKYLLNQLLSAGYKVEFHKEQNLLNTKLQIDIYVPQLNTAIEVDGPSHFLPVWGNDTLKRNIKYDNKKTGLILGKGCVLIRIKQERDFSPSRAKLIWEELEIELEDIRNSFPGPKVINLGDNNG